MKKIKGLSFIKQAIKLFEEDEALQEAQRQQARDNIGLQDMSTDLTIKRNLTKFELEQLEKKMKHGLAEMGRKKREQDMEVSFGINSSNQIISDTKMQVDKEDDQSK